jgi:hypothetical protein
LGNLAAAALMTRISLAQDVRKWPVTDRQVSAGESEKRTYNQAISAAVNTEKSTINAAGDSPSQIVRIDSCAFRK